MTAKRSLCTLGLLALLVGIILLSVAFSSVQLAVAQAPDPAQIELGARLYAENCAVCHGADGQGRVGAELAKDWPSIRPDATIRATIERGISGSPMPAWSQANGGPFTSAEIDALVAFVLTWQTGGPRQIAPAPTSLPRPVMTAPPEVEGDPNAGAVLYDQNCAVCHGLSGEGRIGARLARAWSSIRPDLNLKTTISNGIQGSTMPAWSQENGGPLSETDINNLVAFVLTFPAEPGQGQPTAAAPAVQSPLAGSAGVLLTLGLFILIVFIAIYIQTRGRKES